MVSLAKKVLAKTITIAELYSVRDADLTNGTPLGMATESKTASSSAAPAISATQTAAMKRPAAAAFEDIPCQDDAKLMKKPAVDAKHMKKPAVDAKHTKKPAAGATAGLFDGLIATCSPQAKNQQDVGNVFFSTGQTFPEFLF